MTASPEHEPADAHISEPRSHHSSNRSSESDAPSFFRQPIAVWATAAACVFGFMGIGLVDPILPAIAENLHASEPQVSLLFTSYFAITAVMMLITGVVSSRIGGKRTLVTGLGLISLFSALAGLSTTVGQLIGFRAGWGVGNSLFMATALAIIIAVASGGRAVAIILFESAMGLGLATGPLLGALLGGLHWRAPFFGTAVLMILAMLVLAVKLPSTPPSGPKRSPLDPLRALRHRGLLSVAVSSFFYYFAFFTVLAFTPFILHYGPYGIGLVFFGWGSALAAFSVFVAPMCQRAIGSTNTAVLTLVGLAAVLLALGCFHSNRPIVIVLVIVAGALLGINNTLYTEMAMGVSDVDQPTASAGYSFVRWIGGALAPVVAASLGKGFGAAVPYWCAAVMIIPAILALLNARAFVEVHEAKAP